MANKNDKVVMVALSQIFADTAWNVRSGKWEGDEDEVSGDNFKTFVESCKAGIKDPIELRPNPDGRSKQKHPYSIVAGFRRFKAAQTLGFTEIPATISEMTEEEARERNLQENVGRANLKGSDVAWGIADIAAKNPKLTDAEIGAKVGMTQSHVSKLRRIMQELPPRITKAWREATVVIRFGDMLDLLKVKDDPKEVEARFKAIVEGRAEAAAATDPNDKKKKALETLQKKAFDLGSMLGKLVQLSVIEKVSTDPEAWAEAIGHVITVPNKIAQSRKKLNAIVKSAGNGYQSGLVAELEKTDEDEDEDEESEPTTGTRRAANG